MMQSLYHRPNKKASIMLVALMLLVGSALYSSGTSFRGDIHDSPPADPSNGGGTVFRCACNDEIICTTTGGTCDDSANADQCLQEGECCCTPPGDNDEGDTGDFGIPQGCWICDSTGLACNKANEEECNDPDAFDTLSECSDFCDSGGPVDECTDAKEDCSGFKTELQCQECCNSATDPSTCKTKVCSQATPNLCIDGSCNCPPLVWKQCENPDALCDLIEGKHPNPPGTCIVDGVYCRDKDGKILPFVTPNVGTCGYGTPSCPGVCYLCPDGTSSPSSSSSSSAPDTPPSSSSAPSSAVASSQPSAWKDCNDPRAICSYLEPEPGGPVSCRPHLGVCTIGAEAREETLDTCGNELCPGFCYTCAGRDCPTGYSCSVENQATSTNPYFCGLKDPALQCPEGSQYEKPTLPDGRVDLGAYCVPEGCEYYGNIESYGLCNRCSQPEIVLPDPCPTGFTCSLAVADGLCLLEDIGLCGDGSSPTFPEVAADRSCLPTQCLLTHAELPGVCYRCAGDSDEGDEGDDDEFTATCVNTLSPQCSGDSYPYCCGNAWVCWDPEGNGIPVFTASSSQSRSSVGNSVSTRTSSSGGGANGPMVLTLEVGDNVLKTFAVEKYDDSNITTGMLRVLTTDGRIILFQGFNRFSREVIPIYDVISRHSNPTYGTLKKLMRYTLNTLADGSDIVMHERTKLFKAPFNSCTEREVCAYDYGTLVQVTFLRYDDGGREIFNRIAVDRSDNLISHAVGGDGNKFSDILLSNNGSVIRKSIEVAAGKDAPPPGTSLRVFFGLVSEFNEKVIENPGVLDLYKKTQITTDKGEKFTFFIHHDYIEIEEGHLSRSADDGENRKNTPDGHPAPSQVHGDLEEPIVLSFRPGTVTLKISGGNRPSSADSSATSSPQVSCTTEPRDCGQFIPVCCPATDEWICWDTNLLCPSICPLVSSSEASISASQESTPQSASSDPDDGDDQDDSDDDDEGDDDDQDDQDDSDDEDEENTYSKCLGNRCVEVYGNGSDECRFSYECSFANQSSSRQIVVRHSSSLSLRIVYKPDPGCKDTSECREGYCINGECSPCSDDSECISGICIDGECYHTIGLDPTCGNGINNLGEECDDGNTRNGDGCSSLCKIERTLVAAVPLCGNRILEFPEECDDANLVPGDGCNRYCEIPEDYVKLEVAKKAAPQVKGEVFESPPLTFPLPSSPLPPGYLPPSGVPPAYSQAQYGFPQYPSYQQLPSQLPLAQLQPLIQAQPPVGDTGPAAVAVIGAGAAAGFSWMRRKRRK